MTCSSFSFAGSRDHESHYHGEFTKSIFLPYYAPFSSNSTPMITATLPGGRQHGIAIDTGSTGLLLGAPLLPDIDPSAGTPAHSYLSSSRILYTGRLVEIPIKFHGRAGATAVARVPVLVVDESVVCPWYDPERHTFACPYNPNEPRPVPRDLSKIAYMGVGFGRNGPKEGKPIALPSLNPFINVVEVNGENVAGVVRQGYTMSTEGVQLGLTAENTRGFVWKDLEPGFTHDKDRRDWAMVGMCFSLDDRGRHCGPALIDTGVAQMYLRTGGGPDGDIPTVTIPNPNPNGYAEFVQRVKPGTKITVEFPREDQGGDDEELEPVEEYSFRVGEGATLMEPAYVVPAKRMSPAFVNTGRNFLYGCSVAFDAEGGRFGFRRVTTSSSSL
ncbi:hypothetical protein BU24DRAFT_425444 [Aaosphaeria arxii CBS 175.79]|uniref:Acid protease n=1 Tax=Aaosphaeria arxii CBS 175.79 TaxID=1450172 RepID=A0A6A5XJ28_9PLEO|nr:uncharacterized protein BU24DRAFT_425444 [Aaosphaeria arxii CBS 175.79]KAF2012837.1 hypothetical protein BU24DRAFT_425444 [Aaosphaeria arxii CBS 175.79]